MHRSRWCSSLLDGFGRFGSWRCVGVDGWRGWRGVLEEEVVVLLQRVDEPKQRSEKAVKERGRRGEGRERTALIFSQGASSLTLRINRASARRMLVVRSIPAVEEVPPLVSSAELSEATASGLYWVSGREGERRGRRRGRGGEKSGRAQERGKESCWVSWKSCGAG